MNLFRSEEDVRRWVLFDPYSEDGIRPIVEFAALFGLRVFRERFALDYLQRLPALRQELLAASERFAKGLTVLGQPSAVIIIQTGSGAQPRARLRPATERQANVRLSPRRASSFRMRQCCKVLLVDPVRRASDRGNYAFILSAPRNAALSLPLCSERLGLYRQ